MANTIASAILPRIIGEARETLSENMAFLNRVNKNFSNASGKVGQVVGIGVPAALTAASVSAANTAPAPTAITNGSATVTIDQFYKASFAYSGTDFQNYDIDSLFMEQLKEAVRAVAYQMNSDALSVAWLGTPYAVGNCGTGFFASNADGLLDARKALVDRNVDPAKLDAIIATKDAAALGKIDAIQQSNTFGTRDVIANGFAGRVLGFNIKEDQQIGIFTKGTITGDPTMGAAAVTTKTSVITCDTNDSIALKAGDLIAVDGATYSVQADLTVGNSDTGTLTVDRNWETALDGDEALAFATASDGDGGVFDANTLKSMCGDWSGLSMVVRKPSANVLGYEVQGEHYDIVDPMSGVVLDLGIYPQYHQVAFEVSAVWGTDVTDSRKLLRLFTTST
jgi:hypothetical protein